MISLEEVLKLHELSISFFGGSHSIRDKTLLESALGRAFQTFDNEDLYPSAIEKAAALLESIVKNHPFVDGNKRTGFLAALILLKKNKMVFTATEEDAYEFVIEIASSQLPFEEIVDWLTNNSTSLEK